MTFFGKRVGVILIGLATAFVCHGAAAEVATPPSDPQAPSPASNSIEAVQVSQQGPSTIVKLTLKQPLKSVPASFSIANPARVAIDFPGTDNGLGRNVQQINEGDLRSANIVQVGDRTRVVFNLRKMPTYDIRMENKDIYIAFAAPAIDVKSESATGQSSQSTRFAEVKSLDEPQSIRDIKFRRGPGGESLITVDLSSANVGIDIRQQGSNLVVDFAKTQLPDNLRRRLDVTDFATPVTGVNAIQQGELSRLIISPTGLWEHNAYQSDTQFVIEVKPIEENPNKLVQGSRGGYQGEKLSLNFQSVEVRAVLLVIADFSQFNIITSDSVAGTITLRLKDVPWDQALDIILKQKGLDMRKTGNVIRIAPSGELAAEEKAGLESRQQLTDLEPTRSESFQINYQKAEDIQKLLGDKNQPVLSKRGSVVVDAYTNKLFVTDTPSRLNDVRQLISLIDKPAKQVMVEAKVIQASETFDHELGVKLGLYDAKATRITGGQQGISMSGGSVAPTTSTSTMGTIPAFGMTQTLATPSAASNLLGAATSGKLAFSLYGAGLSRILNVEIAAMEADGRGKKLSNPRVVTGNNVKAIIEDGSDVPILVPGTGTSPPSVSYRKAKLSLEVTPQITPDGRVKMKLVVAKEEPNWGVHEVLGNPEILSSKVETDVMVENGGTVVIGGVSQTNDSGKDERIPFLGDIPYVGFLFKHKKISQERKELLIFITPKILDEAISTR